MKKLKALWKTKTIGWKRATQNNRKAKQTKAKRRKLNINKHTSEYIKWEQFIVNRGHKPHNLNINHHTDGEKLLAAPDTTKQPVATSSVHPSAGDFWNCNPYTYNEGHKDQHPNRDIS